MAIKSLSEMQHAEKGRIVKIRGKADLHRWLFDSGLTIGTIVEMNGADSTRNPTHIMVKGSELLLNKEVVANITVKVK